MALYASSSIRITSSTAASNEDSLLKPFRQRAGLSAPGDDMGGWYSWAPISDLNKPGDNGFAPGHSFGQYLSALSRYYAATGDRATQEKVLRIVRNFAPAISSHFWDDNRFPAYTYDKIAIGLIDAHEFAGDKNALKVLISCLCSGCIAVCQACLWGSRGSHAQCRPHCPLSPFPLNKGVPSPLQTDSCDWWQ